MQSGKKTALLNRPIQHLYLLEACIAADSNPCITDIAPVAGGEDDPQPVPTTSTDGEELPERGSTTGLVHNDSLPKLHAIDYES